MYQSQVTFTFDTICPWTFLAKKRLDKALEQVRASPASSGVAFTPRFESYQLHPELPDAIDKQDWYVNTKFLGNADANAALQARLAALAAADGLTLRFDGPTGNTFHAHRVVQLVQEEHGSEAAGRLVDALYRRYFSEARHPAADDTLTEACVEAGLDEAEASSLVQDKARGERQARDSLRRVARDVDAVPVVVVEGKRRDMTLTGAKEVDAYIKALETVIKEST
jgi:predicted DsbA family dithiol-disulfide isomerase